MAALALIPTPGTPEHERYRLAMRERQRLAALPRQRRRPRDGLSLVFKDHAERAEVLAMLHMAGVPMSRLARMSGRTAEAVRQALRRHYDAMAKALLTPDFVESMRAEAARRHGQI